MQLEVAPVDPSKLSDEDRKKFLIREKLKVGMAKQAGGFTSELDSTRIAQDAFDGMFLF